MGLALGTAQFAPDRLGLQHLDARLERADCIASAPFGHLRPDLLAVSRIFYDLAHCLVAMVPAGPERTVSLRKLLEQGRRGAGCRHSRRRMTDRDTDPADSDDRRRRAHEALEDSSGEIDDVATADHRRTVNPGGLRGLYRRIGNGARAGRRVTRRPPHME